MRSVTKLALLLGALGVLGCGDNPAPPVTPSIVFDMESLTVAEGDTLSFTVALSQPLKVDGAVQLTVADGTVATVSPQVVTFAAGDVSPKTIMVTGVQDNDLADEMTTITASAPDVNAVTVDLTVTDDDSQALVLTTDAVTITEGGTGTIGVSLAFEPSANTMVTVTPADTTRLSAAPATLTFTAANYATAQTVTLAAAQDADIEDDIVNVAFASSGVPTVNATVTITDDDTQGISVNPGSLMITEGGGPGTFNVWLNQQPSSDVVINLASTNVNAATVSPTSLTLTPANYNDMSLHVVTVTPVDDDDTADHTLAITLSGGGLDTTVPVTVLDDDEQAIVPSTTTVALDEGSSTTVGVHLAFDPGSQVSVTVTPSDPGAADATPTTLTFDSSNYATAQQVTIAAPHDNDLANESVAVMLSSTIAPTVTIDVSVTDDDSQDIVLSYSGAPGALDIQEGTSATVDVALAFMPDSNVTVMVGSNDATLAVGGSPLTFTPGNYNVPQPITLTANEDGNLTDETVTVTFTDGSLTRNLTVNMLDNDVQGFNITALAPIPEGGSQTFDVSFNFAPASPTNVTIESNNPKILVNGSVSAQVTIQPTNTPVSVTVSVVEDPDAKDETATLTLSANGVPDRTVQAHGIDDEMMAFVVSPVTMDADGQRLDVDEGGTASFTVALTAAPTQDATVTLTPSATNTVTLSTTGAGGAYNATGQLTFTAANYATPQTVHVRGLEDPNLVDEIFNITISGPDDLEAPNALVFVRKIENDAQSIITVPGAPGPLMITEGTPGSFTVRLEFQPATTVQVTVTPNHSDSKILVNGSSDPIDLLFTTSNYDQPQTVTVTTPQDLDQFDPAAGTITVSSPALTSRVLEVNLFDDDEQAIVLTPTSLTIEEPTDGTTTSATFTVHLQFEPTETDETITLTVPAGFESKLDLCDAMGNDCGDSFQVTFSNDTSDSNGWNKPVTLTAKAEHDDDVADVTVNVALASNRAPLATATLPVTVQDDDVLGLVLDKMMLDIDEAPSSPTSDTFTVRLNFDPTTDLTVTLTSSDPDAATVSPAQITFTTANWATPQVITVSSVEDHDVRDEMVTITVDSARTDAKTVTVNVNDPDQQALVLGGTLDIHEGGSQNLTVRLAQEPTDNVVVDVSSMVTTGGNLAAGQGVLLDGASTHQLTFTPLNWNTDQTIVVSAPEDVDLDHFAGNIHVVQTAGSTSAGTQENAAAEMTNFRVRDNDSQSITVVADPVGLVNSAQEGGPIARFFIRINSRPRHGIADTVRLTSPSNNIRFVDSGTTTLNVTFNVDEFGQGEEKVVEWYVREFGETDFTGEIELTTVDEADDQPAPFGAANADAVTEHVVRSVDDDNPIIDRVDYPTGFNGATNFTQRSNVAFGVNGTAEGIVAFTARSAVTGGNAKLGFTTRLPTSGNTSEGPQFGTGGAEPTTEIVLFDPDTDGAGPDIASWIVFSSDATGIVYHRFDLAGGVLVGPVIVAPAADNPTDFSVVRRGENGSTFAVVYRREQISRNNLYFRSVSIDGTTGPTEQVITTANSFVHFHPTIVYLGETTYDAGAGAVLSPYAVLYSEDGRAKIVRLRDNGGPLATTDLTSVSSGALPGDFASAITVSEFDGIVVAAVHATGQNLEDNAVFLHYVTWGSAGPATYVDRVQLTYTPLVPVSPPFVAYNGVDFAVAFDDAFGGENTVGVALFSGHSGAREFRLDQNGDEGVYPSITWALDRWVLRYQAVSPASTGIRLRTGSFEGVNTSPQL